jgi:hypothetical protein|tara:strand:+ start:43 stop:1164 length:1122 start_codon:yes stop_codon:yes gene_type:complete
MTSIPSRIITTKADKITIGEILSSYDPENYANASTKYRKPSYQRALSKNEEWCIDLVDSVLRGYSTGAITMSRWCSFYQDDSGNQCLDEFYNVEDGQTRLNAYMRFKTGDFDCTFGSYDDLKDDFNQYQHAVIIQEKANSRIRDVEYFITLNKNFSLLQEGTALNADDRYWVSVKDEKQRFPGSPLVNYTLQLINSSDFSNDFANTMGLKDLHSKKKRKNISNAIGFISGCIWGPDYANNKYFLHVPKLMEEISDDMKRQCEEKFKIIFSLIQDSAIEFPNYTRERFTGLFVTTQKFTGSIIYELHENPNATRDDMEHWKNFITEYRKKKYCDDKDWLNNDVYNDINDGAKRNCTTTDFKKRMDAVIEWNSMN